MEGNGVIRHIQNMLRIKDNTFPPNSIKALRQQNGMTLEKLGEAIGTDASTVRKLENSLMRVTDKWLEPLMEALDATADEILRDPEKPRSSGEVRSAEIAAPRREEMRSDLPVRGTAAGSHLGGSFQLETAIVDYVRRPPALLGAMNAYALYVEGTSMIPEHRPGDLRFVHPDRPPRLGDSVVVQVQNHSKAETEAVIGHLLKRTEKAIVIGKLNPEATVELKRETVKSIHKILTLNELFGV